ncbi:hypothetical protein STRDD11_01897 [Streptococcus sp. DD11]|uniref:hypothetical protein n=1 Tax=Streptococcus sp. DD11 TaxID=1777879 RepID=UPI00079ABC6D|nr:hypothetical protein [Streptococcus sp. DD11]KXT82360.1 hypothetical protein STRDD11_01897 [Streptococcus sp. DD11]
MNPIFSWHTSSFLLLLYHHLAAENKTIWLSHQKKQGSDAGPLNHSLSAAALNCPLWACLVKSSRNPFHLVDEREAYSVDPLKFTV